MQKMGKASALVTTNVEPIENICKFDNTVPHAFLLCRILIVNKYMSFTRPVAENVTDINNQCSITFTLSVPHLFKPLMFSYLLAVCS